MSTDSQDLKRFVADESVHKERLDVFLAERCGDLSRSRIKALIQGEQCQVDGVISTNPAAKISAGANVALQVPPPVDANPKPQNIDIDIVYEDDHLLVINKQAGLTVHPGAGQHDGTLVNALLYHCKDRLSSIGGVVRPGIVHRLDKETSGLLVVAKTDQAHAHLSAQLADRTLTRIYHAFVWGQVELPKGHVDEPIGRHPVQRTKMAVRVRQAKAARTHYRVVENFGPAVTRIECKLETGRTHQIRVHMTHIGHSLVGDSVYNLDKTKIISFIHKGGLQDVQDELLAFPRQALHAHKIGFIHPATEEYMEHEAPLPTDLIELNQLLGRYVP